MRIRAATFWASKSASRREEGKLGVTGLLEEILVQPGDLEPQERVAPRVDDCLLARLDQGPGEHARADRDRLSALDAQAVIDQQAGPACGHEVGQVRISVRSRGRARAISE